MKKSQGNFFSILLALVITISMLTVPAFAAEQNSLSTPEWIDSSTWDTKFVAVVNKSLGSDRAPDAVITQKEMEGLFSLSISVSESETMDINGIQFASNLDNLNIEGHVEGLGHIASCSSMTYFSLKNDNVITDLQELKLPATLKTLSVKNCPNLISLKGLTPGQHSNLEILDVSGNRKLSDISVLSNIGFPKLHTASFAYSYGLTDITPLKGYTSLTVLNLERAKITEERRVEYRETISSLIGLEELHLAFCNLSDEDTVMFAPLKNLNTLVLAMNKLTNAEFCKQLPETMETLSLHANDIQDASGLSALTNLKVLNFGDNMITDFTFAKNMTKLTNWYIRHVEGTEKFPFLESFDYNNGKPVEIGTDGTLVLENPYIDINGQTISFQNAEVSVLNTEELDKTIMVNENGKTLTLSNVVPGTITLTATYDFPTLPAYVGGIPGKLGKLKITVRAVEKKPDGYTIAYDWGKEVPEGIDLPVDNKEYATQADAEAAVNQSYSNGTTVKGEKNGKEGVWTFSGWTISVDGLVVKATGSWSFTEHQHDWDETTYIWAEDMSTCTAKRVCKEDSTHVETETAKVTAQIGKHATCISKGETIYTAIFQSDWASEDPVIEIRKNIEIDQNAHIWDDGHVTTLATCASEGVFTYTCLNDASHMKTEAIPVDKNAHIWGGWKETKAPTYENSGEEIRICQNDSTHIETRIIEKLTGSISPGNPDEDFDSTPTAVENQDGKVPQTGDNETPVVWIALMGLGVAGTATTVLLRKRRSIKKN